MLVCILGAQDPPSIECTQQTTLPPPVDPALKTLQLTEALRAELEGKWSEEEQVSLRKHISTDTANVILKWLERDQVSTALSSHDLQHSDRVSMITVLYNTGNTHM